MNQDQINTTGMQSTTANYMEQNKVIWTGNKAVTDTVGELEANNTVISQKRDTQETAMEGALALALQAKGDLEDKISEIADQIYALASKTNNVMLMAQSHFTASQLDSMDPDKLQQTGTDAGALATANLAGLADYGVTAADVTALGAAVTTFAPMKNAVRAAMSKRVGQTKTLPQAVADNQSLLKNQLDKQMTKFKKSNPEFYGGYHAARTVVNRRSHHASPQPAPAPTPQAVPQK